jgi:hypothetical protein
MIIASVFIVNMLRKKIKRTHPGSII